MNTDKSSSLLVITVLPLLLVILAACQSNSSPLSIVLWPTHTPESREAEEAKIYPLVIERIFCTSWHEENLLIEDETLP